MMARTWPRWKLWHLSALVLVTALLCGLFRALDGAALHGVFALILFVALLVPALVTVSGVLLWCVLVGLRLGGLATDKIVEWGMERGGVLGFAVSMAGAFLFVTVLGLVVVIGMGTFWLIAAVALGYRG